MNTKLRTSCLNVQTNSPNEYHDILVNSEDNMYADQMKGGFFVLFLALFLRTNHR